MRVADTCALYALFDGDDAHHGRARSEVQVMGSILIPAEVFAQAAELLAYRLGPAASREACKVLREDSGMEIQPSWDNPWDNILNAAWSEFTSGQNPSYVDAIVVAWCKKRKLLPWTYDSAVAAACQ